MSAWISIKKQVPEYGDVVLVVDHQDEIAICARDHTNKEGEHFTLDGEGGEFSDVTHWQPLPAPPTGLERMES